MDLTVDVIVESEYSISMHVYGQVITKKIIVDLNLSRQVFYGRYAVFYLFVCLFPRSCGGDLYLFTMYFLTERRTEHRPDKHPRPCHHSIVLYDIDQSIKMDGRRTTWLLCASLTDKNHVSRRRNL